MSIRLRLTLFWCFILAAILVATGMIVLGLFERQQWAALDAALGEEADTSAEAIARDVPSAGAIVQLLSAERDLGAGRRIRLVGIDGQVLQDGGMFSAELPAFKSWPMQTIVVDGQRRIYRYAIAPLLIGKQPVYLEVGVDATPIRNSIARLRAIVLLALPAVLILCSGGGWWLAGRTLAPMSAVSRELAAIEPRDLSRRLAAPHPRDEIGRLIAVINGVLERVERASLAERRFAADAAHELRTPLSVLRTGLEVALARERTPAEDRASLQAALEEVVNLCQMADDLLMAARLEGQVAIHPAPVVLGELISEVASSMEPLAESKGVRLSALPQVGLTVRGDAAYLKRLMLNLVDNAIKFTPSGGSVEVKLEQSNGTATIRVRDEGPGIKPDEMPRLFERFFRGSAASDARGSGLGLSLCREIVRLHGGAIDANSSRHGSEFVVTLPL